MGNVKEILRRKPPRILYHYTTQQGLLGIIRDKGIWASHTQYLNDVREFRHALDLVKEELSAMNREGATNELSQKCLVAMETSILSGLESINVCVCSFSEQGDVLSQWRAYGGATSGFAVGFSSTFLREMSDKYGWLVPVIYDEGQQRLLVRTLLGDVLKENLKKFGNDEEESPEGGNLIAYLYRYAPILKHHSFSEEHEWRIITRPILCTTGRFGYRTGGSMLIPYFRLPLAKKNVLGIEEIIIGPTPHPGQSSHSVEGLLLKHGFYTTQALSQEAVITRCSEIPYRSW